MKNTMTSLRSAISFLSQSAGSFWNQKCRPVLIERPWIDWFTVPGNRVYALLTICMAAASLFVAVSTSLSGALSESLTTVNGQRETIIAAAKTTEETTKEPMGPFLPDYIDNVIDVVGHASFSDMELLGDRGFGPFVTTNASVRTRLNPETGFVEAMLTAEMIEQQANGEAAGDNSTYRTPNLAQVPVSISRGSVYQQFPDAKKVELLQTGQETLFQRRQPGLMGLVHAGASGGPWELVSDVGIVENWTTTLGGLSFTPRPVKVRVWNRYGDPEDSVVSD